MISKIIIGLGNPGQSYENTRHNVGNMCVDQISESHSIDIVENHRFYFYGQGQVAGKSVVLVRPKTFVNNTGNAITSIITKFRVSPDDILVVYDDMDLQLGFIRIRARGSAGGHNGVKSIIRALGTEEFARLRIGIGRPPEYIEEIGHVLGRFGSEEIPEINRALEVGVMAFESIIGFGIDHSMNEFNNSGQGL